MEKNKRLLFASNAIISALAIICISIALGTEYWIVAYPQRIVEGLNITEADDDAFKGYFHAGLFAGEKDLNYGYGVRENDVEVDCDAGENRCIYKIPDAVYGTDCSVSTDASGVEVTSGEALDDASFNFGLWLCTILAAVLSIAWGIVAVAFAILNASIRPIEIITGPVGLYIWNSIAAGFGVLTIVVYSELYAIDLSDNILEPCDIITYWSSEGRAHLDYSFYFIVIATVLYLVNIVIMILSGIDCSRKASFSATMSTKALDGTMMY